MAAPLIHVVINREDGTVLAWNGPDTETPDSVVKDVQKAEHVTPILFISPDEPADEKLAKFAQLDAEIAPAKVELTEDLTTRVKEILDGVTLEDKNVILEVGDLTLDQDLCVLQVNGETVEVSPTEFKLLRYFMLNPNRVLSKTQILDYVWEYDFNGDANIVESYISYLRKKLGPVSSSTELVTRRGFGYMLRLL